MKKVFALVLILIVKKKITIINNAALVLRDIGLSCRGLTLYVLKTFVRNFHEMVRF